LASSLCMTGQTWVQQANAGLHWGKTQEHTSNAGLF
jgi:hypothetical protein